MTESDMRHPGGPGDALPRPTDYRHAARQLALQFLYQLAVQNGANLEGRDDFLREYGADDAARKLARGWIDGAWRRLDDLDARIAAVSTNWDLKRLCEVDRANLRLGVYQLLHCPDIPMKVVINEAVDLADEFSTAQAAGFINGVLDAIRRQLLAEMDPTAAPLRPGRPKP